MGRKRGRGIEASQGGRERGMRGLMGEAGTGESEE